MSMSFDEGLPRQRESGMQPPLLPPFTPGGPGDKYGALRAVLGRAFEQAAHGKGAERHAQELPFERQPMQQICDMFGRGFALGQACKKMQESQRLPRDRAVAELLGAINYIAGVVIHLEAENAP